MRAKDPASERLRRQTKRAAKGGPSTIELDLPLRTALMRAAEQHNSDPRNPKVTFASYARMLLARSLAQLTEGGTLQLAKSA